MIGSSLAALVALSFLALGAGAFAAPSALGENYGLPAEHDVGRGYVRALGSRDAALGLLIAWCLATNHKRALAATIGASTLVACCDFLIVVGTRGSAARKSLAIHGSGMAGLIVVLAALRSER